MLGVEDFGIYNVVGGVVSLFSFLGGTMASATQRFFSFALGQGDTERLYKTFSINLILYVTIAVLALILLETIGLWFVNDQLEVPPARFDAALLVYHYSIFAFIATICTSPFMAIIIAHEDMQIYAYISIVEAILKLVVVFVLVWLPWDKLEVYGVSFFIVSMINAVLYVGICVRKYNECQFRQFYWDKVLFNEIMGFTGWAFYNNVSVVLRNQAVTILLNQIFNPTIVAARVIASNIASKLNMFSSNFNVGLGPPIIKTYAANEKRVVFAYIWWIKVNFFLMWVFALPLMLETRTVLSIWLKNLPLEAVLFTKLALIEILITSISLPIISAIRATGKMKIYASTLGSIQISIFFVAWIVLKMGGGAYSVYIVAIVANMIMFVVRLLIVKPMIGLVLRSYFIYVFLPVILVICLSAIPSYLIQSLMPETICCALISILLGIFFSIVSMYFIGLDKNWRRKVRNMIVNRIPKLRS